MATEQLVDKGVHKRTAVVEAMASVWPLITALLGGTETMRKAGTSFLPKWPKEEDTDYAARIAKSTLYPAYQHTVETLSAKPFSQEIEVGDDVPSDIKEWLDDIDMQGRNVHAFSADAFTSGMAYGMGGILVEFPDARMVAAEAGKPIKADGVVTQAQEKALGLRPYWVEIKAEQLLGWRAKTVAGRMTFQQLRFMEDVEEADGDFGTQYVQQVRVLYPGRWETYRKSASDKNIWVLYKEGTTTIDVIPFAPFYGKRKGYMVGKPPLLEVAHLNCKHWQSQSDQDNLLHVARVPILVMTGIDPDSKQKFEVVVGSSNAVKLPKDATLEYCEHTGAAIDAGKQSLDDLKEEMRQSGASMLVVQPGEITATQVEHEAAPARCALERMVLLFEDTLNLAMEYTAKWVAQEKGGTLSLFKDFGAATLAEASASLLLQTKNVGVISGETYFNELKRRGILAPDTGDWEDEQERVMAEGPPPGEEDDGEGGPGAKKKPPAKKE